MLRIYNVLDILLIICNPLNPVKCLLLSPFYSWVSCSRGLVMFLAELLYCSLRAPDDLPLWQLAGWAVGEDLIRGCWNGPENQSKASGRTVNQLLGHE